MSYQKLLQQMIGVTLVMLFLVGCGAPPATPVSEAPAATSTPVHSVATPTPEPPTAMPTPVPPTPTPTSTPLPPTTSPALSPGESVIIGTVDGLATEFDQRGYVGIHEFECVAALNCDPSSLPAFLYSHSTREQWDPDGGGVERLTIRFVIDDSVNNTLLRITRAGSETLLISVDGGTTEHLVLASSMGSSEGGKTGTVELPLGKMKPGEHSIALSIPDDDLGNGTFFIDAIELVAED
jgi:hypothetical protein